MRSNQKLTKLLKGRGIVSCTRQAGTLRVTFADGSVLTVRTAAGVAATHDTAAGRTVQEVQQAGTDLALVLKGGGSIAEKTAEETSCVMLRDKAGVMEYAD